MSEMKDIVKESQDKELLRREFLSHFEYFENNDWEVIGWQNMNTLETRWLKEPQKLRDSPLCKMFKTWLPGNILAKPRRFSVRGESVDSVYFALWLAKGEDVCMVFYAEHKFFGNLDKILSKAVYSLTFKNWKDVFLKIVGDKPGRSRSRSGSCSDSCGA